jgi:cell division protein FtsL
MYDDKQVALDSHYRRSIVKKKKQGNKIPVAQFVAIIALSISVFLIVDFARRAAANYRVQREAERLTQEVEMARLEKEQLLAKRTYVASNLYVEEIARKELKWARPGETVVVIMPTPEAVAQHSPQNVRVSTVGPIAHSPAQAWWLLFFGDASFPRYTRAAP